MLTEGQFALMINSKVPYLVTEIVRNFNVPATEAFEMLYASETYRLLSDKETYYWGESSAFVTESFMREQAGLGIENL